MIPCLFACFYESVSCVYAFFSTSLSTCVASAVWLVFDFVSIATFFFPVFFSCKFNRYLCHGALDVSITLLLHLSPLSIYIFIVRIPAYVYLNVYTHFPPLPYSYTFIVIFICIFGVMFYSYTNLFVFFLLVAKHNRHLCYGVY